MSALSCATLAVAWALVGLVSYPFIVRFHERGAGHRTDERALLALVVHPVGAAVLLASFLVTAAVLLGPLAATGLPFAGAGALDPYPLVAVLLVGAGGGAALAHRFRGPVERVVQPELSLVLG